MRARKLGSGNAMQKATGEFVSYNETFGTEPGYVKRFARETKVRPRSTFFRVRITRSRLAIQVCSVRAIR